MISPPVSKKIASKKAFKKYLKSNNSMSQFSINSDYEFDSISQKAFGGEL